MGGLDEVVQLVKRWGLADNEEIEVEPLSGGVSCIVALVKSRRGRWVVKIALPKLMVKEEWLADQWRIFREAECLRVIREVVDSNAAPMVILEDRGSHAIVLEYGEGGVTWKKQLMEGVVDPNVTDRVASIIAKLHRETNKRSDIIKKFEDQNNFLQLRIDPYISHLIRKHHDLERHLTNVIAILLERRMAVVHGDYSPKNILIFPDGRLWVLDCEPAHYGNPVFDIAFCTNHLILKAIHLASMKHLEESGRLWQNYWMNLKWDNIDELKREGVKVLATLMLARIDGKSPVEYLTEKSRRKVRMLSKSLILDAVDSFEELSKRVTEVVVEG
jgi:aminoglycoside phosphotransferase (APT) family kinase protein